LIVATCDITSIAIPNAFPQNASLIARAPSENSGRFLYRGSGPNVESTHSGSIFRVLTAHAPSESSSSPTSGRCRCSMRLPTDVRWARWPVRRHGRPG
jgi:hypothetical protein